MGIAVPFGGSVSLPVDHSTLLTKAMRLERFVSTLVAKVVMNKSQNERQCGNRLTTSCKVSY